MTIAGSSQGWINLFRRKFKYSRLIEGIFLLKIPLIFYNDVVLGQNDAIYQNDTQRVCGLNEMQVQDRDTKTLSLNYIHRSL